MLVLTHPLFIFSLGSNFNLKVQVNDILSRQQLSQAVVEVYINYSRTLTVLTGEDGSVLLHVPYQALAPVTVVASKDGYICTLLPCTTNKLPSKILRSRNYLLVMPESHTKCADCIRLICRAAWLNMCVQWRSWGGCSV